MSGDKVQKLNSEIQKVRQQISDCQRELKDEIFNGLNQGNGRLSPQGTGLFYKISNPESTNRNAVHGFD